MGTTDGLQRQGLHLNRASGEPARSLSASAMSRPSTRLSASAAMVAPVAIPPMRPSTSDHRARQITGTRRNAPGCCPGAAGATFRPAGQGRTAHQYMALSMHADTLADQPNQCIAGLYARGRRTGMPAGATAIHFPSRNAGKTNTRSFGAPNRAVAVPHPDRCADEGLARWLGRCSGKEKQSEYHLDLGAKARGRWQTG